MIALVHGPDAALARAEVAKLVAAHDPAGANTSHLDGREVTLAQVVAAAGSAGFFGGRRVVVVHDLMTRASRSSNKGGLADEADDAIAAPALDLAPLFAAVPEVNLLVLVDAGLAAIPAAVKRAAPANARVVAAEPPRGAALLAWLSAAAKEAGAELDGRTARLLAETLYPQTWSAKPANPRFDRPPDTEFLRNEVEKLVLVAYPDPVTPTHLRALVAGGPDDRVFRFVEAAEGGQLEVALAELERLQDAREEPAKLTAQVAQQIELAAVLAAGPAVDPVTAGRALGLSNPNRMVGIAAARRGRAAEAAFAAVMAAVETDRRVKRGELRQPEDGLYHLLAATAAGRASATSSRGGT